MDEPALQTSETTQFKHERLSRVLRQQLKEGRLKPGDSLPTEQELSAVHGLSRNTIRQSLAVLERAGLITRGRGRGTIVHESALQRLDLGSEAFALVVPETRIGFYPSLQRGFHEAASRRQCQMIVCDTDNDINRQAAALLQLLDRRAAGIAVVPALPDTTAYQFRPLQAQNIPVVFCHRRVEGVQAPLVTFSAVDVGRMAGRALVGKGHRQVSLFSRSRGGLAANYVTGFRQALQEAGVGLPDEFVRSGQLGKSAAQHEEIVRENLREILAHPSRPTAIFCTFDGEAEIVFMALAEMNIRVPEDISLVSFGGRWRESSLARRLSAVTVDEEELARQAFLLLDEIRHQKRPLRDFVEQVIPLQWTEGSTLRALA